MSENMRDDLDSRYNSRADELVSYLSRNIDENEPLGTIAIGGVSGTGKTKFAERLSAKIDSSLVLHIDNYLSPKKPVSFDVQAYNDLQTNQYAPRIEGLHTNDWDLPRLVNDVRLFSMGLLREAPLYDPSVQEIVGMQPLDAADTLLIEGTHSLNITPLQDQIQNRVLMEADLHDRLMRKIVRSSRFNNRPSLDDSIGRYINGSELAWQYYKDEYEKRADYIVQNPANPTVDYAHLSPLGTDESPEYQLYPYELTGALRDGEALRIHKNRRAMGGYMLNYSVGDNTVVYSSISTRTLELLLGYYNMEHITND